MTPDHLRALADQLDAEALEEARAGRIQQAVLKGLDAEKYRKTADEMERVARGEPLPEVGKSRTVRTVQEINTTGKPGNVKRAASRARRKHPVQAILYNLGVTIQGLADVLGEKRARVSHWMGTGSVQRPVPKHVADRLHRGIQVEGPGGKPVLLRIPREAWGRIGE